MMSKHKVDRPKRRLARRAAVGSRNVRDAGFVTLAAASVLTIVVIVAVTRAPGPPPLTPTVENADITERLNRTSRARITPTSPAAIPERGPGVFNVAQAPERSTAETTTYRVEVERGLPFGVKDVATFVEATLVDVRGWGSRHALTRVDGESDLRLVVASPKTADSLCAPLDTGGRLSCRNGSNVVINAWQWQFGADSYSGRMESYRRYVVNHETGHALGYGHVDCPATGHLAPVMLQQTKGLNGCVANPWPTRVDLAGH